MLLVLVLLTKTYSKMPVKYFSITSILAPILFKIYLNYLFLVINNENFADYADDNTIQDSGNKIEFPHSYKIQPR